MCCNNRRSCGCQTPCAQCYNAGFSAGCTQGLTKGFAQGVSCERQRICKLLACSNCRNNSSNGD